MAPSGSSDYLTTSSEDEGYRSRPSNGNRKLKTKRQRNKDKRRRKRCGKAHRLGNTSDSSEFPIQDLPSPDHESNHDGRFRQWFPDEYGRTLGQNIIKNPSRKKKSLFLPTFQAKLRKDGIPEEFVWWNMRCGMRQKGRKLKVAPPVNAAEWTRLGDEIPFTHNSTVRFHDSC